ncbi:MAG: hypothetical protein M3O70_00695 [Actinomycetota bacterium]|nr:hypothetical protein [Actinomycetota bacterium]
MSDRSRIEYLPTRRGAAAARCGQLAPTRFGRDDVSSQTKPARQVFRVLTRIRTGYQGAVIHDVQLQAITTGSLIWSQSFSWEHEAERCRDEVQTDLDLLDEAGFRRKWRLPSNL